MKDVIEILTYITDEGSFNSEACTISVGRMHITMFFFSKEHDGQNPGFSKEEKLF